MPSLEDLVADLPLQIDSYPAEMRRDVLAVLSEMLSLPSNLDEPGRVGIHEDTDPDAIDLPDEAPRIIGVTGFRRHGKDELASHLQRRYRNVTRFAFSDLIILEANAWLARHGWKITEQNKNVPQHRHLLQAWGSGRRLENPNYLDPVKDRARQLSMSHRLVVVTGLRIVTFPDTGEMSMRDLEIITEVGGQNWLAHRPGLKADAASLHPNEAGLAHVPDSAFDRVVFNAVEGDREAFYANIDAVLFGRPQPHPGVREVLSVERPAA